MKLFDYLGEFEENTKISILDRFGSVIFKGIVGDVTQEIMNGRIVKNNTKVIDNKVTIETYLEDEDERWIHPMTLNQIPTDVEITYLSIEEVIISNRMNAIFDGLYRVECIYYIDAAGKEKKEKFYYKNDNYVSKKIKDLRNVSLLAFEIPIKRINIYENEMVCNLNEEQKSYLICKLLDDDVLEKTRSIRNFCKFETISRLKMWN